MVVKDFVFGMITAKIPKAMVPMRNCRTSASENGGEGGGGDNVVTGVVASDCWTLALLSTISALSEVPGSVADAQATHLRIPTTDPAVESRVK